MHDEDLDPDTLPPSKSQRKREAHSVQQLGLKLLEIAESEWQALHLPDRLIDALKQAKRLPARGAHKRQLQYIGKLMRDIDAQPIQAYFEQLRLKARETTHAHQQLEAWRDRMLEEGDAAIEAWLHEHPHTDRQRLRQLVRQANKEQANNKPPRSSRALFRFLRDTH
jgi:ribosome-associated protein